MPEETNNSKEYKFPDNYPKPVRADYATEEEWQYACKKKPSVKEWLEYFQHIACFIPQTQVERLLGLTAKTVKDNLRPCITHLNLMDDSTKNSRYNEAFFWYHKQELKNFLLHPEKLKRRSIHINMYAYPDLISEGTIKYVQEFLTRKADGKSYRQSDITKHLKAFFEPFYIAHCKDNNHNKAIHEQCPLIECRLDEDIELEQLWEPEEKDKKLEKAVFKQGLIQVALFGYTIRNGRSKSRRFIRPLQAHQEQLKPENGEQWVLVGYEAWQRFLKQNEQPAAKQKVHNTEKKAGVESEADLQSKEPLEENAHFTSIAEEVVSGKVKHLFITGEAGTGKTVCICKLVKELMKASKKICLCATTGIAAHNLNNEFSEYFSRATCKDESLIQDAKKVKCKTVHDAFALDVNKPIFYSSPFEDIEDISEKTLSSIKDKEVFIIDEISMLRMDTFSKIMSIIKRAEQKCLSNKQVIVVGDFFQLPPVITNKDKHTLLNVGWPEDWIAEGGYCFFSPWWDFKKEELKQNYRQKADSELLEHLKVIRTADSQRLKATVAWLNEQKCRQSTFKNAISLVSTKAVADNINRNALNRLPGAVQVYEASFNDKKETDSKKQAVLSEVKKEKLLQSFNIRKELELKCGARVIATKNDTARRFVNGSMGSVTELGKDFIKVKFDGTEKIVTINRFQFKLPYDAVISGLTSVEQFPLQLAYAITIHKSQGLTLTYAKISPGSWEYGQLYTALSRVKSAQGLCLTDDVKEKHVKTSAKVLAFYAGKNLGLSDPAKKSNISLLDNIDSKLNKLVREYRANKDYYEKADSGTIKSALEPYLNALSKQIADILSTKMTKYEKNNKY